MFPGKHFITKLKGVQEVRLSEALRHEMLFLLIGLRAVTTYWLLTKGINPKGLLLDKISERAFIPERLQVMNRPKTKLCTGSVPACNSKGHGETK